MTGRPGTEETLEHASEPSAAPSTLRGNAMSRRRPAPDGTGTMGGDRVPEVLTQLEALADPTRLAGMARYGISTTHALGVSMPSSEGWPAEWGTTMTAPAVHRKGRRRRALRGVPAGDRNDGDR